MSAEVTQEIREIVHKCFAAYICSATWHTENCNRAAQLLADYAAKVRLDEAQWWRHLTIHNEHSCVAVEGDKRIAELERSAKLK